MMSGPEILQLADRLVAATKEGALQDWVERLGEIVRRAGLPLEAIDWRGAPAHVAVRVVDYANRAGGINKLETALKAGDNEKAD